MTDSVSVCRASQVSVGISSRVRVVGISARVRARDCVERKVHIFRALIKEQT